MGKIGVKIDSIASIWYQNFKNLIESLTIFESNVKFFRNFAWNLWLRYKNGSHFSYKKVATFQVSAARLYPNHTWVAPQVFNWAPKR